MAAHPIQIDLGLGDLSRALQYLFVGVRGPAMLLAIACGERRERRIRRDRDVQAVTQRILRGARLSGRSLRPSARLRVTRDWRAVGCRWSRRRPSALLRRFRRLETPRPGLHRLLVAPLAPSASR